MKIKYGLMQLPGGGKPLKIVWSLSSFVHFCFLLVDLKMELESNGKWAQDLRAGPSVGLQCVFTFISVKHAIAKRNPNIYMEHLNGCCRVTMTEGFCLLRSLESSFGAELHKVLMAR